MNAITASSATLAIVAPAIAPGFAVRAGVGDGKGLDDATVDVVGHNFGPESQGLAVDVSVDEGRVERVGIGVLGDTR
jgi:hypothetical protein